jgi:O-acetyl-ADP-ribose deacetylase (regulator of RNase III)
MWCVTTGNLLESDFEALVNTVNTVGVMGKGVALQFKKAFPEMFREYEKICKEGKLRPGQVHVFDRGAMFNPRYIINFPTKRHWRGKSKIEDIRSGLKALLDVLEARGIRSIAIPPLGCGQGGLDWADVLPLIQNAVNQVPHVRALIFAPTGSPDPSRILHRTPRPQMTARRANVLRLLSDYCVLGYELTLLEIQKLLYFLQVSGEPLKLHFRQGIYGPYADNLRHVLHQFEGHFIEGFCDGRNQPRTPIRLFPDVVNEAVHVSLSSSSPAESERMTRVVQLIQGFESPYGLELLASVHWAATQDHSDRSFERTFDRVSDWNERKRKLMKREHVRAAWRRLHDEGWL